VLFLFVCSFYFLLAKPSKARMPEAVLPRRGSFPMQHMPNPLFRR